MSKSYSVSDAKLNIEILLANIESFEKQDQFDTIDYLEKIVQMFKIEHWHTDVKITKGDLENEVADIYKNDNKEHDTNTQNLNLIKHRAHTF